MRSMWKGHLRFHLVTIPIKLYAAEESAARISFNQLHKDDFGRIGYVKTCKKCGREVAKEDIVSGYQYEPDQYVVIQPEEIDNLKVKSARVIEIEGFVDATEIHPTLFEQPYYAGPDGPVAVKSYQLLKKALEDSGKIGVGRVSFHDKESLVAMAPYGPGFIFYKLRFPHEVRKIDEVPQINEKAEVKPNELKLAEQLIETMVMAFKDIDQKDHYQEALLELIHARIEGREVVHAEEEEREVVDIMSALEESIERARANREPIPPKTRSKGRQQALKKKEAE